MGIDSLRAAIYRRSSYLNYGTDIIVQWARALARQIPAGKTPIRILDIGCGRGIDIGAIRKALPDRALEVWGIEQYGPHVEALRAQGVTVFSLDIEKEDIPLEDGSIDIVIANQVLEHTKEIFWITSEISRVLKKNTGILIAGVPNLAAFHNRVLFLFGQQPTCAELMGPHVRAITAPAFRRFIETDGWFALKKIKGSNFYPFPASLSKVLSAVFPGLSVSLFFLAQRTSRPGLFIEVLNTRFYETVYYTGGRAGYKGVHTQSAHDR